jgi:hypothetical protein
MQTDANQSAAESASGDVISHGPLANPRRTRR